MLSRLLTYAASLVPEIADNMVEVDQAMRTGYNFKRGPFEMIDQMGAAWLAERLRAEKMDVPKLLESAAKAGGFYKVDGGRLNYLDTMAPIIRSSVAKACCCCPTSS